MTQREFFITTMQEHFSRRNGRVRSSGGAAVRQTDSDDGNREVKPGVTGSFNVTQVPLALVRRIKVAAFDADMTQREFFITTMQEHFSRQR